MFFFSVFRFFFPPVCFFRSFVIAIDIDIDDGGAGGDPMDRPPSCIHDD